MAIQLLVGVAGLAVRVVGSSLDRRWWLTLSLNSYLIDPSKKIHTAAWGIIVHKVRGKLILLGYSTPAVSLFGSDEGGRRDFGGFWGWECKVFSVG